MRLRVFLRVTARSYGTLDARFVSILRRTILTDEAHDVFNFA